MEIYDPKQNSERNPNGELKRGFFPKRDFNSFVPFWEKLTFFLADFLGLSLIATIVSGFYAMITNKSTDALSNDVFASTIVQFICYLIVFLIYASMIIFSKRQTWKTWIEGFKDKKTYIYAACGVVLIFAIDQIFGLIYNTFASDIYGANSNQVSIDIMAKAYPALTFFPVVLFAPFVEELAYRVGLVDTIGHKEKNTWIGILVGSLIFAAIHFSFNTLFTYQSYVAYYGNNASETIAVWKELMNELLNFPVYFLSGLVLALVYCKSGHIASSMLCHLSNNLLSFILIFVTMGSTSNMNAIHFFSL